MVAVSELLGVKEMFGALLAGMAITRLPHDVVEVVRTKVKAFALVFFTPIYFAIVGLKLDLLKSFDPAFFLGFFLFCCVVKSLATAAAGRFTTGDWLSTANLAAALNTRCGPGIVLASVQGRTAAEAAAMYAATAQYAREVIHAFNTQGFAALDPNGAAADPVSSGRSPARSSAARPPPHPGSWGCRSPPGA